MYTTYYGFNEKPFTLTPNPRFIYLSKNHKEAFAHLLYGINNHYGFIELIGEVGTGKTTVLRTLLGQLNDENYRSALIFNPCVTGVELLRSINHEFGLNAENEYSNELLEELNSFLLKENARGVTVVLVIDEAQNLSAQILEQLRLISNLETENDKLIQIVLAGQPELSALLNLPELRQLNQRIAVRYRLHSMSMDETRSYIRHRMVVAGETGGVSFSRSALKLIHLYSRGLPRLINNLCDRALLVGYGDERRCVTASTVLRAIRELITVHQGKRFLLTCTVLISVTISCITLTLYARNIMSRTGATNVFRAIPSPVAATYRSTGTLAPVQTLKSEMAAVDPKRVDSHILLLQREILSYEQNDVHLHAFNAIADRWGVRQISKFSGTFTVPVMFSRLAAKRNLRVTAFRGTLDEVIRFDVPFLALIRGSDNVGGYYLAVTSLAEKSVSISPSLFDSSTLSKSDLNTISSGTFYLVWRNYGQIPEIIKQGDTRYEINALQRLLQNSGTYSGPIDGTYSTVTAKAVNAFQRSIGISLDETVGELTLAALTKYNTNQKVPSLSAVESTK